MRQLDQEYIKSINDRYSKRLALHGNSPKTLGWSSVKQQQTRFERFYSYISSIHHNITDIGCGFGDFASFLNLPDNHFSGEYNGVDLNPKLLDVASTHQYSFQSRFFCGDLLEEKFHDSLKCLDHDVIIAAGIFNLNFYESNSKMTTFLFSMLEAMVMLNPSRIIFDFIPAQRSDSYPQEDYIAVYDISSLVSYLNTLDCGYIIDLMQPPNPMTEALLVIDLK